MPQEMELSSFPSPQKTTPPPSTTITPLGQETSDQETQVVPEDHDMEEDTNPNSTPTKHKVNDDVNTNMAVNWNVNPAANVNLTDIGKYQKASSSHQHEEESILSDLPCSSSQALQSFSNADTFSSDLSASLSSVSVIMSSLSMSGGGEENSGMRMQSSYENIVNQAGLPRILFPTPKPTSNSNTATTSCYGDENFGMNERSQGILPDGGDQNGQQPWQLNFWQSEEDMGGYSQKRLIQVEVDNDGGESFSDRPHVPVRVIDESELEGQSYVEIGNIAEIMANIRGSNGDEDIGGYTICHDELMTGDESIEGVMAFACSICPEKFDKKLLLNNHMKYKHGVHYVFTERGRKVKLVRLPEGENGHPKLTAVTVTPNDEDQQDLVEDPVVEEEQNISFQEENGEGLGCGFAVKLNTPAYEKTLARNEVPFVAFVPIMSQRIYLLKVTNYSHNNQLLQPATKNDVMNAFLKHNNIGSIRTKVDRVPIVAHVQQVYNKETNSTDFSIGSPFAFDLSPKFLTQEKFINLVFANSVSDPVEVEDGCEMDDERPFVPTPTCAPKRQPPTGVKRRGRPRKLKFNENEGLAKQIPDPTVDEEESTSNNPNADDAEVEVKLEDLSQGIREITTINENDIQEEQAKQASESEIVREITTSNENDIQEEPTKQGSESEIVREITTINENDIQEEQAKKGSESKSAEEITTINENDIKEKPAKRGSKSKGVGEITTINENDLNDIREEPAKQGSKSKDVRKSPRSTITTRSSKRKRGRGRGSENKSVDCAEDTPTEDDADDDENKAKPKPRKVSKTFKPPFSTKR